MQDVQITSRGQQHQYGDTVTKGTVKANNTVDAIDKLQDVLRGWLRLHRHDGREWWHPYLTKLERIDGERFEFEYREEWTG